jgi:hypothetical protein
MKVSIVRIVDRGVPNQERLHLSVLVYTDLSFFMVVDTVATGVNSISSTPKHSYWFAPAKVKPGDNVVLYTGPGTDSQTRRADGGTDYFFFWNLPNTIWHTPAARAVLFEVLSWETSPA